MAALKVLLDVGSRNGESVEEFVRWDFDEIHAFEPMPDQFANIVAAFSDDPRVHVHNFGLSDRTGTQTMYGSDVHGEASVFPTKTDLNPNVTTECEFVRASDWFADNIAAGTDLLVKLNCEGSEIAILHDLLDSGEFAKVRAFRVEFDISRCVGHEDEADLLLERLDGIGFDQITIGSDARLTANGLVDRVPQVGTHHERLYSWLAQVY